MTAFHEINFPVRIALGSTGGPERRTEIVMLGSGREERNSPWADSRRKFNVTPGIRTADDLDALHHFFEERRGRLFGFRFQDPTDHRSKGPNDAPAPTDQRIGTGDGATTVFALVKVYGSAFAPWSRPIAKPQTGTVRVAVDGVERTSGWSVDTATGLVSFAAAPAMGAVVTAGFRFDVPVRFDADFLDASVAALKSGGLGAIELIEIRP